MTDNNDDSPPATPLPYSQTTSWSPCHVGRAMALVAAHPDQTMALDKDEDGKVRNVLWPRPDDSSDIYGSDLLGWLESQKEKKP